MADLHDTIVRLKSYANTTRNVVLARRKTIEEAVELLKEQQKIIDRYHQADTFLDAHGWKWKDGEHE